MCIQKVGGIIATSVVTKTRTKEIPIHIGGNMINQKTVVMNVKSVEKNEIQYAVQMSSVTRL